LEFCVWGSSVKNKSSVINVPDGEFKFPDCDSEAPLVIMANETLPLGHKLTRPYPWWKPL
jgi:hypothetical protein